MTSYFDAVVDANMNPLCNGTQEEVLAWLEDRREFDDEVRIFIGRSMKFVTVKEYLEEFG